MILVFFNLFCLIFSPRKKPLLLNLSAFQICELYVTPFSLLQYYTSPVSDCTFTTEKEVLDYLFSGKDERILESKEEERAAADSTLHVCDFFYKHDNFFLYCRLATGI